MKREKLRRTLAFAILEELGPNHIKTIPNIDRYVIPKRTQYRINSYQREHYLKRKKEIEQ